MRVGPLKGKIPLTPHGHKDFTCNQDQIEAWWQRWPNANIGARVPTGHVVIDIDPRNGGDTTWANLIRGHRLPATLSVLTGSGGWHHWYRLPHSGPVRKELGPGIDLKTHSGYLVMPRSLHPTTGRPYLVCPFRPTPALLPNFLIPHVYKPTAPLHSPTRALPPISAGRKAEGLLQAVAQAKEGSRNQVLFWAACRAAEAGLRLDERLLQAALHAGLSEAEATRTIYSAHQQQGGAAA
ncbi:DNA primase [Corynebacterium mastitidis]|uniref:DNA primase n=1 Tax=Corynebacterium mastitidis TaxID=161890 RepID=A0A2N0X9H9_9CORY|nr:DNA primase [Corynebacterium mastitidis]